MSLRDCALCVALCATSRSMCTCVICVYALRDLWVCFVICVYAPYDFALLVRHALCIPTTVCFKIKKSHYI